MSKISDSRMTSGDLREQGGGVSGKMAHVPLLTFGVRV